MSLTARARRPRLPGPRRSTRRLAPDTRLSALASFPEENPNAVIELAGTGAVTYMNPVAKKRFPDLAAAGFSHPILRGISELVVAFEGGSRSSQIAREIEVGADAYEQKVCFTRADGESRVRIYSHDITRRKRAEEAIQKLAKRVVRAQEEERHRLSRELHDEAGQALTALKLSLELIAADSPAGDIITRPKLEEAIALVDTTRERLRSLARGLRPPSLDTLGLNATLEALCRDFSRRTHIPVRYFGMDVSGLADAATVSLYRVLQEALTNVAKHAAARSVSVVLAQDARRVRLVVGDDGRGFREPQGLSSEEGLGLRGMHERLEIFGGRLRISSGAGRGVRLVADLPKEES